MLKIEKFTVTTGMNVRCINEHLDGGTIVIIICK